MKALNQSEKALLRLWITQNQPIDHKVSRDFAFLCASFLLVVTMPLVVIVANGGSVSI